MGTYRQRGPLIAKGSNMGCSIVSEDALVRRIKSKLKREGVTLRQCPRRDRRFEDIGDYFLVDAAGTITGTNVDLEELGRESGVLNNWEDIEDE